MAMSCAEDLGGSRWNWGKGEAKDEGKLRHRWEKSNPAIRHICEEPTSGGRIKSIAAPQHELFSIPIPRRQTDARTFNIGEFVI
jgi:hypothetical protein